MTKDSSPIVTSDPYFVGVRIRGDRVVDIDYLYGPKGTPPPHLHDVRHPMDDVAQ